MGDFRLADTLFSLHTIICFFCHSFRILPENPHYTGGVNISINYRQSGCGWKTGQLNSAAVVGEVMSRAEPRTAVLGVQ